MLCGYMYEVRKLCVPGQDENTKPRSRKSCRGADGPSVFRVQCTEQEWIIIIIINDFFFYSQESFTEQTIIVIYAVHTC